MDGLNSDFILGTSDIDSLFEEDYTGVEEKTLDDKRFTDVWGGSLRKISFTASSDAPLKGKYEFLIKRIR